MNNMHVGELLCRNQIVIPVHGPVMTKYLAM